jgi:hypothetical protein
MPYIVSREHEGHSTYYCDMEHGPAPRYDHTPRWQGTKTYAWRFASRGDASVIAKKVGRARRGGAVMDTTYYDRDLLARASSEAYRLAETLPWPVRSHAATAAFALSDLLNELDAYGRRQ